MNLSNISYAPATRTATATAATYVPILTTKETRHPVLKDVVNLTRLAGATAGVSAATSALVPAGDALGQLGVGTMMTVAGGLAVGAMLGRMMGETHPGQAATAGLVIGGVGGAGAALATGLFGASPVTTAVVAGAGVLALGVVAAIGIATHKP